MPQPADESSEEMTEELEETDEEEETEEDEEEETDEEDEADEKLKAIAEHEAQVKAREKDDDDEFAYEAQQLTNQPHDEAVAVDGEENLPTPPLSTKAPPEAEPFNALKNDTHDAAVDIGDGEHIATPRNASPSFDGENLKDQPHDAAFSVSNASEEKHILTPPSKPMPNPQGQGLGENLKDEAHDMAYVVDDGDSVSSAENDKIEAKKAAAVAAQQSQQLGAQQTEVAKSPEAEGEDSSSDEEAPGASPGKAAEKGLYDPAEYEHLHTSKEVTDLFQFITVYKAHDVEVEPKLHPFIPDYIPAIGDIDGFIKVPRPDGKQSSLGLSVLDEPGSSQSNASVVRLGLEYEMTVKVAERNVERVEQAQNKSKVLDRWIEQMRQLHQNKHRPTVTYTKPMPDLETLLQVWPAEFEDLLSRDLALPPALLDLDIVQYVKVVCALLDIPTYVNLVESVHVLLSLYSEFRANPHFQGGAFSNLPL